MIQAPFIREGGRRHCSANATSRRRQLCESRWQKRVGAQTFQGDRSGAQPTLYNTVPTRFILDEPVATRNPWLWALGLSLTDRERTHIMSSISLHCITSLSLFLVGDARSTVQTEQAMPPFGRGRGAGPRSQRQQITVQTGASAGQCRTFRGCASFYPDTPNGVP